MNRFRILLIAAVILFLFSSCNNVMKEDSFFALDTTISLQIYGSDEDLSALKKEIIDFDVFCSPDGAKSVLRELNENRRIQNEDLSRIIKEAEDYRFLTGGAFDYRLGSVSALWGFGTDVHRIPSSEEIGSALKEAILTDVVSDPSSGETVLSGKAVLDLGAIGKGVLADRLSAICKERGIRSALISLGGNLTLIGARADGKPRKIAILGPDGSSFACYVEAEDVHVVTSGIYQRFFTIDGIRYCHVIDPSSGNPVDNELSSVTVFCERGGYADAISTALLVMGTEKGLAFQKERSDFEAIFIKKDGTILSTGIPYTSN